LVGPSGPSGPSRQTLPTRPYHLETADEYTSNEYQTTLNAAGIEVIMSRHDNCWDKLDMPLNFAA
jgi:hypothetical protein